MAMALLKPSFSNKINSPSNSNFQGQNAKISFNVGGQQSIANFYPTETTQAEIGTLEGVQDCIDSFKGRESILKKLSENIANVISKGNEGTTVRSLIQVLSGVGGVGKTETVRKYILTNKKNFRRVVWIKAAKYKDARNCFIRIAEDAKIQIRDRKGKLKSDEDIVKQIFAVACQRKPEPREVSDNFPSLIVFDNVEEIGDPQKKITNLLPQAIPDQWVPPVFIVTTRQSNWEKLPGSQYIELQGFDKKDTWTLLRDALGLQETRENGALVEEVRTLYDGLPLVMQQVIAFVKEEMGKSRDYTLTKFLKEVQEQEPRLLNTKPEDGHVKTSVSSLYELTTKKLSSRTNGTVALNCLDVMALLNPEGIPRQLLLALMKNVSPQVVDSAIQLLLNYKLITLDAKHSECQIHRVVQLVRRQSQSFTVLSERFSKLALFSLLATFRYSSVITIELLVNHFRDYVSDARRDLTTEESNHGLSLLEHVKDNVTSKVAFDCIDVIEDKLKQTGFCPHICVLFLEIALKIAEREKDVKAIRKRKLKLANGYFRANDYDQALRVFTEVIASQVPGRRISVEVLESKEGVARVHQVLLNFDESEKMYKEVLKIQTERNMSKECILTTKTNLMCVYWMRGKKSKAKVLYNAIIPEIEMQIETISQTTLQNILMVAIDLEGGSVHHEAKDLLKRLRSESKKNVLFPRDKRIFSFRTIYALVVAYGNPSKQVQAEKIIKRLVSGWETQPLPSYSSRVAQMIPKWIQMAEVFEKFKMYDRARQIYDQLVSSKGLFDDDAVLIMINLSRVLKLQGKNGPAAKSLDDALFRYMHKLKLIEDEELLGPTSNNLALEYEEDGDHERAGRIYKYHFLRHQNAIKNLNNLRSQVAELQTRVNLARVFMIQHNYAHAEILYEEILPALESHLSRQQEETLTAGLKSVVAEQRNKTYKGAHLWFYKEIEKKTLDGQTHCPRTRNSVPKPSASKSSPSKSSPSKSKINQDSENGGEETTKRDDLFEHVIMFRLRLEVKQSMAKIYRYQENYGASQRLYTEVISQFENIFGRNHAETLEATIHLAAMYCDQDRYEEAERRCERVLSARRSHEDVLLQSKLILAVVYFFNGKQDQAQNLFNEVLLQKKQESKEFYFQPTFKMFIEIYYNYFSNDGNGDRTTTILRDHQNLFFSYKDVAGQRKLEDYFTLKTIMDFIKIVELENGVAVASEIESDLELEFEWEE